MKIEEVKHALGKIVKRIGSERPYRLVGCVLRKNDKGYYYQAELLDVEHGNSVVLCALDDVEVQ